MYPNNMMCNCLPFVSFMMRGCIFPIPFVFKYVMNDCVFPVCPKKMCDYVFSVSPKKMWCVVVSSPCLLKQASFVILLLTFVNAPLKSGNFSGSVCSLYSHATPVVTVLLLFDSWKNEHFLLLQKLLRLKKKTNCF